MLVRGPAGKEDMDHKEATEWLTGERSMNNIIPQDPRETWQVRVSEADAWNAQQAYWTLKAHKEGLLPNATEHRT